MGNTNQNNFIDEFLNDKMTREDFFNRIENENEDDRENICTSINNILLKQKDTIEKQKLFDLYRILIYI